MLMEKMWYALAALLDTIWTERITGAWPVLLDVRIAKGQTWNNALSSKMVLSSMHPTTEKSPVQKVVSVAIKTETAAVVSKDISLFQKKTKKEPNRANTVTIS